MFGFVCLFACLFVFVFIPSPRAIIWSINIENTENQKKTRELEGARVGFCITLMHGENTWHTQNVCKLTKKVFLLQRFVYTSFLINKRASTSKFEYKYVI